MPAFYLTSERAQLQHVLAPHQSRCIAFVTPADMIRVCQTCLAAEIGDQTAFGMCLMQWHAQLHTMTDAVMHPPMNDTQLMYVGECRQDGQRHFQGHSLLCHGPALLQKLLQQVPSRAMLHDYVYLLAVLKCC